MPKQPSEDALLAEYAAANSIYLTYDGFRWQAGSFLIAGVFVYWGFLLDGSGSQTVAGVSSILVALLMSCWMLFANHYRQLYLFKLERLWEIELQLGIEQHLRFTALGANKVPAAPFGPKGHRIDMAVYVFTSLGGSVIIWARQGFSWVELGVIPIVLAISIWVMVNESRTKKARRARTAAWRLPEGKQKAADS